jgi:hypothetical protein
MENEHSSMKLCVVVVVSFPPEWKDIPPVSLLEEALMDYHHYCYPPQQKHHHCC